jgi:hypothetical protein
MPFPMPLTSLKIMRRTTHPFYWSPQPLCGAWMFSMNTSKARNLFCLLIISNLKKWVIYTQKAMNCLQAALLEHDFVIQYKKGAIMPADYLSCLPSTNKHKLAEVTQCSDPFQPEYLNLQKADSDLQKMHHFRTKVEWRSNVSKSDANYLPNLAAKLY